MQSYCYILRAMVSPQREGEIKLNGNQGPNYVSLHTPWSGKKKRNRGSYPFMHFSLRKLPHQPTGTVGIRIFLFFKSCAPSDPILMKISREKGYPLPTHVTNIPLSRLQHVPQVLGSPIDSPLGLYSRSPPSEMPHGPQWKNPCFTPPSHTRK